MPIRFTHWLLIVLTLLLCGCFGGDDNEYTGCINSSDYQDFECINLKDFKNADGESTTESQTIANCTILSSTDSPCDLNTLPFIAAESTTPSKAQIMSRLIVSHAWMAENFSAMLDNMPPDMYNLFASVTAIVIHDEIRPAFFWSDTGAIYIDPYYLWTTEAQYNTISLDPDYRSDFGDELNFISLTRYTKNGAYAFATGNDRSETQTLYALSAVLFHELAHARDAFPVSVIVAPLGSSTPANIETAHHNQRISVTLEQDLPLQDATMFDLADVMYQGSNPSAYLISLSASDVGAFLEADVANDDYAYSSIYEDTAMLFEEVMMKIHYDIDREMVYATPLNDDQSSCDDFSFDWTYINRYADVGVIPRVTYVVDGLLPGHTHTVFLNNPVADGVFSWCEPVTPYAFTPHFSPLASGATISSGINRNHWH